MTQRFPLLGIYSKEIGIQTNLIHPGSQQHYSQWSKDGNNPNIHQLTSGFMIRYYAATERNRALVHTTTWMNPENIVPRSNDLRSHIVGFCLYAISKNGQMHRARKWISVCRGVGTVTGSGLFFCFFFLGLMEMFWNWVGLMVIQHSECTNH